jgi:hypothetical protein
VETNYPLGSLTAQLRDMDKPEHGQSFAYYEARALEDFMGNAEYNMARVREIRAVYTGE